VIEIAQGLASSVIKVLMVLLVVALVWWIVRSVMRQAMVPIVISVMAAVAVAWVMWGGGLEFLVGKTETEVTRIGRTNPGTIPFDFGE